MYLGIVLSFPLATLFIFIFYLPDAFSLICFLISIMTMFLWISIMSTHFSWEIPLWRWVKKGSQHCQCHDRVLFWFNHDTCQTFFLCVSNQQFWGEIKPNKHLQGYYTLLEQKSEVGSEKKWFAHQSHCKIIQYSLSRERLRSKQASWSPNCPFQHILCTYFAMATGKRHIFLSVIEAFELMTMYEDLI